MQSVFYPQKAGTYEYNLESLAFVHKNIILFYSSTIFGH